MTLPGSGTRLRAGATRPLAPTTTPEIPINHTPDRPPAVPDRFAGTGAWAAYQSALSRYAARQAAIRQAIRASRQAPVEPPRPSRAHRPRGTGR